VLLELSPAFSDENRKIAERNADVWIEPDDDGRATIGAELNAEEAAEGFEFINTLAVMATSDGRIGAGPSLLEPRAQMIVASPT